MFGIGVPELILILIIGLVVFGPGKLPEIGRAVGKSIREFKKATAAVTEELEDKPEKKRREAKIESVGEKSGAADDRGGDGQ